MSRCDYEGVFYRVFCASLLLVAFIFTVILTNVFIDIDGLLSRQEQELAQRQATEHVTPPNFIEKHEFKVNNKIARETEPIGFKKYDDEGVYRTKRSLDSTDFLLHIKNPKIKNVLANRLATLLEELDDDESKTDTAEKNEKPKFDIDDIYVTTEKQIKKPVRKTELKAIERKDDDLHTAMHNLLREGIVGHMDLQSVYKKVHELVKTYKTPESKKKENCESTRRSNGEKILEKTSIPTTTINEESKFFEELVKCKTLQQEVKDMTKNRRKEDTAKVNVKTPKFLIKTLIDIQKNDKEASSKENVNGIIRLIYNGKSIKIKSMDEYEATTLAKPKEETTTENLNNPDADVEQLADLFKVNKDNEHLSKTNIDHLLAEYLKKYKKIHEIPENPMKYVEKRLKRDIKVSEENQSDKHKKNDNIEDDELFVEIETHYDNKGTKGKKKEELVKQLIEKIQKAIRSNQEDTKQLKHLHEIHVRKRFQSPLDHKNESKHITFKDIVVPYASSTSSFYRELYPISKVSTNFDPLPTVNNGEVWLKKESGPKFISTSKSINSAELAQVDVDLKKVVEFSGVPQRLQIPLNTDLSGETQNAYFDLGNLQYLFKDLEGSGFSIGLNQYIDHAPDPESTKLFTGIDNLVSKYQRHYDQKILHGDQTNDEPKHEMKKRDLKANLVENKDMEYNHKISRRSIYKKGNDYHSNQYNFLYQDNMLPYNNFQEIYENKENKVSYSIKDNKHQHVDENEISIKKMPEDLESIFEKKLKPSEIFDLASLLDRKKRSVKVRRFKNSKRKLHMSTFLNTNAKPTQRLLFKTKRNKRQIGKIRIVAKDNKGNSESDENIYIVSGEKVYADRAIIRRVGVPTHSVNEDKAEEQMDDPILFENTKPPLYNVFEETVRGSPYMMNYPHIFLDDMSDKFNIEAPTQFGKYVEPMAQIEITTERDLVEKMPSVHDLVNALKPYPKSNYKVSVKFIPRENNISNAGFREIHTSINKTFNKNGMFYTSQVNVSEISKIESANTSVQNNNDGKLDIRLSTTPNSFQNKHEVLKSIIKEHKERIDKQLENLNKEKEKLTFIMLNNTHEAPTRKNDQIDIIFHSNLSKLLHLSKEDISKVFCSAIKQQESTTIKADSTTAKSVMDPLKVKLLKAISQNEQLTSQILNKIDQNSIMLQSFLSKISDKIQTLPDITRQVITEHEKKIQTPREQINFNYPDPHFYMKAASNISDFGVPFVYYQQPNIRRNNKLETPTPVAITVYSGYRSNQAVNHIMKAPMINADDSQDDPVRHINNSSRYFVDDDYIRTFVAPVTKLDKTEEASKSGVKDFPDNLPYRLNMPKPQIVEKKVINVQPFKFKSNAPKNVTKS